MFVRVQLSASLLCLFLFLVIVKWELCQQNSASHDEHALSADEWSPVYEPGGLFTGHVHTVATRTLTGRQRQKHR